MPDTSSFWTDIKKYEERLAISPDSFCFAKLSETYLKVGLIDDALHTARQGVAKHPAYLAGQRALALACHAKGHRDECLTALWRVAEALPEDQETLKLLGRLLNGIGDQSGARRAFLTVLDFNPDDTESRLELESLDHSGVTMHSGSSADLDDDEEIIEDLEILEELEVLEEDQPDSGFPVQEMISAPAYAAPSDEAKQDPLSTGTLAELYVAQGFIHKALEIYRDILAGDPANRAVSNRVAELELLAAEAEPSSMPEEDFFEEEPDVLQPVIPTVPVQETAAFIPPVRNIGSDLPLQGSADNALETLEGWLENIRRVRSCR